MENFHFAFTHSKSFVAFKFLDMVKMKDSLFKSFLLTDANIANSDQGQGLFNCVLKQAGPKIHYSSLPIYHQNICQYFSQDQN